jgi:hypothetical protein
MKPFDIFIIYISWGTDGKSRPVLAFLLNESRISVFQITSQYKSKSNALKARHFKIDDWSQAGLDKQSYVDTGTLISLPMSLIKKKESIGELSEKDKQRLLEFLTKQVK